MVDSVVLWGTSPCNGEVQDKHNKKATDLPLARRDKSRCGKFICAKIGDTPVLPLLLGRISVRCYPDQSSAGEEACASGFNGSKAGSRVLSERVIQLVDILQAVTDRHSWRSR